MSERKREPRDLAEEELFKEFELLGIDPDDKSSMPSAGEIIRDIFSVRKPEESFLKNDLALLARIANLLASIDEKMSRLADRLDNDGGHL